MEEEEEKNWLDYYYYYYYVNISFRAYTLQFSKRNAVILET